MEISTFATTTSDGLCLTIKAKPAAARARAPKVVDIGDGKHALEIAVAAAPEDGKANQAIIDTLAKALNVKKSTITIKTGASSRLKIITVTGAAQEISAHLTAWLVPTL